jgi:hypothetical protein
MSWEEQGDEERRTLMTEEGEEYLLRTNRFDEAFSGSHNF